MNNSNDSILKSPMFWILLGLTGFLLVVTFTMHIFLGDAQLRNDDLVLVLGSSGGNGFVQDQEVLQQQHSIGGHHHHNNKRHHHEEEIEEAQSDGGGKGGGGDGASLMSGMLQKLAGGGVRHGGKLKKHGNKMADQISNFMEHQEMDRGRRERNGQTTKRESYEQKHSYDNLHSDVQNLRLPNPPTPSDLPYDIYHCPMEPPKNYPFAWSALDVLENWNPDDTDLPTHQVHQGLCVFNWDAGNDKDKALAYREAQVPFIIQNIPEVTKASVRWSKPNYVSDLIGSESIRNEHSVNNHFMFWKTRSPFADYTPPTDMIDLTYQEWYTRAKRLQDDTTGTSAAAAADQNTQEHWYFRLNAMLDMHGYTYEELPFFDPSKGPSLTMIHPNEHRGINCRFGMKGVTAESHYDSSSNFIALMGGQRRYILAHPDQCQCMELYPQGHPSGRHSAVNWSTVAKEIRDGNRRNRPFAKAQVNEVILQAGDMMYLPTDWFHFIVSLNINFQCNSRSGTSYEYEKYMDACGFPGPPKNRRAEQ